jgi:hypothetical protein
MLGFVRAEHVLTLQGTEIENGVGEYGFASISDL